MSGLTSIPLEILAMLGAPFALLGAVKLMSMVLRRRTHALEHSVRQCGASSTGPSAL